MAVAPSTSGFRRASANIRVPGATLSRRIAAMEREFGVRPFNRTTRKVELTEAGRRYFERCGHLVDEARSRYEDILRGRGVTVIDPHGDLAERLVASVPPQRRGDLVGMGIQARPARAFATASAAPASCSRGSRAFSLRS